VRCTGSTHAAAMSAPHGSQPMYQRGCSTWQLGVFADERHMPC
jgi:hypothetical protein